MATIERNGLRLETDARVYDPSHDTWLLADHAGDLVEGVVLDIGCGAGAAAITAALCGNRVLALDINPRAVALTRRNAQANGATVSGVVGTFWRGVRLEAVQRMLVNPPYLPTHESERVHGVLNLAFDAGHDGRTFLRSFLAFLEGQKHRLRPDFEGRLVASSLQGLSWVQSAFLKAGLDVQVMDELALPHERLALLAFGPSSLDSGP